MSHELQVYHRSQFQNVVRWFTLGVLVTLDITFLATAATHVPAGGVTGQYVFRIVMQIITLALCNCALLPSVVLEARKVEVFDDKLVIRNLLYTMTIPWNEITKVSAPIFLKFAIVRTKKWFALINKRDVQGSADLIQIIREKTETPAGS